MIYLIVSLIVIAGVALAIYTHSNKIEIKKCTCLNFEKCNSQNCSCDQNCRCYDNELVNENLDTILDEEEPIIVEPAILPIEPVIEPVKIEIPKKAEPKKAEPKKPAIKKKPKKK